MKTMRLILAIPFAVLATILFAEPAAADNCDIFINAEDCQNTGWTVGILATLAGGVAVATAATLSSQRIRRPTDRPSSPLPPDPLHIGPGRPRSSSESRTEDIAVRAVPMAPTVTIAPRDGAVTSVSMKLVAQFDEGRQTVREVHRGTD